jgi:hypothetical protein
VAEFAVLNRLDRLPAADRGSRSRFLWMVTIAASVVGIAGWVIGGVYPSVVGMWAFIVAAVSVALVLPWPYPFVSPLYAGIVGWLVDMLPLLILTAWTAAVLRWAWSLWRERRMPRGGRWIWLPIGLSVWTGVGVVPIALSGFEDFKHFLLLVGIQFVVSGTLLAAVDLFGDIEERAKIVSSLAVFISILSGAVFLQWAGVPVESLQDGTAREAAETAYGLDAFPNVTGMIKYARSVDSGADDLSQRLDSLNERIPDLDGYEVLRSRFSAFDSALIVFFEGSARPYEDTLAELDIRLIYDHVGLAPSNTLPRLRSFPRNALTYAGVCVVLFPMMLWLAWSYDDRRRWLGRLGAASCLFGSGFSLARGSWIAILVGVVYLLVDGALSRRRKLQLVAWFLSAAVVLSGVYLINYGVDPVSGRAGGGASVRTRQSLYGDTVAGLKDYHLMTGYGTERPRITDDTSRGPGGGDYIPRAGTHSTYLNYLFRTGLVGVVAIVMIYLLAALSARTGSRAYRGKEKLFATLVTAAVVSAMTHGAILSLYVEPTYTLTVSLFLGLATLAGSPGTSLLPWRNKGSSQPNA